MDENEQPGLDQGSAAKLIGRGGSFEDIRGDHGPRQKDPSQRGGHRRSMESRQHHKEANRRLLPNDGRCHHKRIFESKKDERNAIKNRRLKSKSNTKHSIDQSRTR
jgi:hypothetical protein